MPSNLSTRAPKIKPPVFLKRTRRYVIPRTGKLNFWYALYKCECGVEFEASMPKIKSRHTKSCGCLNKKRITRHGKTFSPEYVAWDSMIQRCTNPNSKHYENYGGRGITVCSTWLNSATRFLEDMGPKPSKKHSLDRIDNSKGYSKGNCKWATRSEQARNHRRNVNITYKGETKCLLDWANHLNINPETLRARLLRGWSIEKSLNTRTGARENK